MIDSPFIEYCQEIDKEYAGQGLQVYEDSAFQLFERDPKYITNLLISDFIYRAKYQMNIIMSVEGEQGDYKSLFSLFWAYKLGEIFGTPFEMEKNLYAIPEDLDNNIRTSDNRTTHFLDEQRRKNVGVGSQSVKFSLMDYEEQCRYTQKNIIYASPEVHEHAHYFVFRSYTHERVSNKVCDACKLQPECVKNRWETMCEIPFYERIGYPKSMTFFLFTRRKVDKHEVLRGLVQVPMPTPDTLKLYDRIKGQNIKKLESQEEDSFKYIKECIDSFVESEKEKLVRMSGELKYVDLKIKGELVKVPRDSRKYIVANEKLIENYLYQFLKSRRKFTYHEIKLIIAGAKDKLLDICQEKNSIISIPTNQVVELEE